MHRTALESVVEILAVNGGAVHQRRPGRAQRAGMADHGAGTIVVAGGQRRLHIVLVADGETEADAVDGEVLALLPQRCRQARGIDGGDAFGELLGDGNGGNGFAHCYADPIDVIARLARAIQYARPVVTGSPGQAGR
jgi:hypothetical protein